MLAYHGREDLRKSVMERHEKGPVEAKYWVNSGEKLGIPEYIVHIKYVVKDYLTEESRERLPYHLVSAIAPGADLSIVHLKFLYWFCREELPKSSDKKYVAKNIHSVLRLLHESMEDIEHNRHPSGVCCNCEYALDIAEAVDDEKAYAAITLAENIARYIWKGMYFGSILESAYSCVENKEEVSERMYEKLIELIREAPVTERIHPPLKLRNFWKRK